MSIQRSVTNALEKISYAISDMISVKMHNDSVNERNLQLIYDIQPACNMAVRDKHIDFGDSYMSCIHLYAAPEKLRRNWLFALCKRSNVIVTVDVETLDNKEVKRNLDKAIDEQESRFEDAKKMSEARNAANTSDRLKGLLDEVLQMGNSLKAIHLRLFVYSRTFEGLENNVTTIEEALKEDGFGRFGVNVNEQGLEYRSFFLPIDEQNKTLNGRKGIPCPAGTLAFGLPFHYVGWKDPGGFYLGDTPSSAGNGAVIFNPFYINSYRNSYDGLVIGRKGYGKSTTLKTLIEQNLATGNKVRCIDVEGDFSEITRQYGGIVVKMDGSAGGLNPLEILRVDVSETTNYLKHMTKMSLLYRLKKPTANDEEINDYKNILSEVYSEFGIDMSGQKITGRDSRSYPIFSDVLNKVQKKIIEYEKEAKTKKSAAIKIQNLVKIESTISDLINNYGSIFNCYTDIGQLMDADIINFDLSGVVKLDIYGMQLFNVMSMAVDSCMTDGIKMKTLYDHNQISLEDIVHHVIYIDEAHKVINTSNLSVMDQIIDIMRQDRKYFIGIWLATQSIKDMCPNVSSTEAINTMKTIFELTQYKLIFNQDNDSADILRRVCKNQISDTQLEDIPTLQKRELMLNFGCGTIEMKCKKIEKSRLEYYGGGA